MNIEPLETRIAPATFYVSSASLNVLKDDGTSAMDTAAETTARTLAGADIAFLMTAGDKLVLDLDHDHKADGGEPLMLTIVGGRAMVLMNDLNSDGAFDAYEMTGLAVSDGFNAKLNTDVHGAVVTALDANDAVTMTGNQITLQNASIVGLTSTAGTVESIAAGHDVAHIKLGKSLVSPSAPSTALVSAGNPTSAYISGVGFGGASRQILFTPAAGQDVGDIFDVTLTRAVNTVFHAGDSAGGANVMAGGSISGVTILDASGVSFFSGSGGNATAGLGGEAGTISNVKISSKFNDSGAGFFSGYGGKSSGPNTGRDGGDIFDISIKGADVGSVNFNAGGGGKSDTGIGGAGGDTLRVKISATSSAESLFFTGGTGGNSLGTGSAAKGGAGGVLDSITVQTPALTFISTMTGGEGGNVAAGVGLGGNGGALSKITFSVSGSVAHSLSLQGGAGGTGGAMAGTGGSISATKLTLNNMLDTLTLAGGDGGIGGASTNGGAGGDVFGSSITARVVTGETAVTGGAGGASSGAKGGNGGAVHDIKQSVAFSHGHIGITGGAGGSSNSTGLGEGGDISRVSLAIPQGALNSSARLNVVGGAAGAGSGSPGGSVSDFKLTGGYLYFSPLNPFEIAGGAGDGAGGGGDVIDASISAKTLRVGDGVVVRGGAGGATGVGGAVDGFTLTAGAGRSGAVTISGGDGAGGGAVTNAKINLGAMKDLLLTVSGGDALAGSGGNGGSVEHFSIATAGDFYRIDVTGGNGAGSATGSAGGGGAVRFGTVVQTGTLLDGFRVTGGAGGDATSAMTGGFGGNIEAVTVTTARGIAENHQGIFQAGAGGSSDGGTGGGGGSILGVTLKAALGGGQDFILAGKGGASGSGGTPGDGGGGGNIRGVIISAPRTDVHIGSDVAGAGGAGNLAPGDAGEISNVRGTAAFLTIVGGSGGAFVTSSYTGQAGKGGDIFDVVAKVTGFARQIRAGAGGERASGLQVSGDGGDIHDVKITGDIGNFDQSFGVQLDEMGGLIAGRAGTGSSVNGSIQGIIATRIAAIYAAGSTITGQLTSANAVSNLSNITAGKIGADLDGNGAFDFTNIGGTADFDLGTDTPIDGLVLVTTAGYATATVKPVPLKVSKT